MIVKFKGRSKDTCRMKLKPIPEGYKIYALCDAGYTYTFHPDTPQESMKVDPVTGFAKTSQIVEKLVYQLDYKTFGYNVYMDNYFSNVKLFQHFRDQGIGAAGTVKRSVVLTQKNQQASKKAPWNTRAGFKVAGVLGLMWKDNGPVTMLTTIHSFKGSEWDVSRKRRRPKITSTNGPIVRKVFQDDPVKQLNIPRVIHDYNNFMNGVDIADQLRSYYTTHKSTRRNWMPVLFWLIDVSVVNSFKLVQLSGGNLSQRAFRDKLVTELVNFTEKDDATTAIPEPKIPKVYVSKNFELDAKRLDKDLEHMPLGIATEGQCILCRWRRREGLNGMNYKKVHDTHITCTDCEVYLCCKPGRNCFFEYHKKSVDVLKQV